MAIYYESNVDMKYPVADYDPVTKKIVISVKDSGTTPPLSLLFGFSASSSPMTMTYYSRTLDYT